MKKTLLLSLLTIVFFVNSYGQSSLWNKVSEERISGLQKMDRSSMPSQYELFSLDFAGMKAQLQLAPLDSDDVTSSVIIAFPNSDGKLENYRIYEAPVMEAGLASRFQDIKSYSGVGVENPAASIRFSTTIFGLHVMSLSGNSGTYYIDTYTKDLNNYIIYSRNHVQGSSAFNCLVQDEPATIANRALENISARASDGIFRTYRLAMACTIEYAAFHVNAAGLGTGTLTQKKAAVLAAMVVSMTRINGIYERDMSLRMNLIANNDLIIFIDADSFSNSDASALINESQTVIDGAIGFTNYDIGHTVSTGGGGLAQLNSPCGTSKARGITGSPSPVGDPFDIDYVAHEMGHQFGGTHTFNNSCGGNRSAATAIEPGSGTTIMGYAGICAPDIQGNSDAHFHAASLAQMNAFVGGAGNCSLNILNLNAAPVVNAGLDYTIPKGTAFILKGVSTDANGDSLTYCWEQTNIEISTQPPTQTAVNGPNFRSNPPSTSPNRYMPAFSQVLLNNLAPTWEVVPNVARTMAFALTVRDNRTPNGGQTNRDNMIVTFAAVGPFTITNPTTENVSWNQGSTQTITWSVAGTTANNINTANVNILLSTDGGATFPIVLAANTLNDGTQTVTMPSIASTSCRIMVEAVGNIFYAVTKNIALGYSIVNACNTYTDSTPLPFVDQAPGSYTTRTLNVPITGTISDVNVSNNITHMYLSDVQTDISSPQAPTTFVKLFNRGCGATNGTLNLKFNDGSGAINCAGGTTLQTVAPGGALTGFNGQNPQGIWTFRVYDNYSPDTGTINSWAIEVCTQTTTLNTANVGFDNFAVYPNPNNGNFNIQLSTNSLNGIKVLVHDIRGRLLLNNNFTSSATFNQNIQLNNAQAGVYLLTVTDGERKQIKKIVVE